METKEEFEERIIRDRYFRMLSEPERYDIYEQNEIRSDFERLNCKLIINAL